MAACRDKKVRYSITVRQHAQLRNLIEAIPEDDWTPIPYWMEGAADVAETSYTPFASEPNAVPVRLIVRRVQPTPGSQLALLAEYSYHAFITDRDGDTLELEADHRRHAEIENAIRDLKYGVGLNHLPSGRFPANAAWLAVQTMAHPPLADPLDHAHRSGRAGGNHQDPPATLLLPGRAHHPQGTPAHLASPPGLALAKPVQQRPGPIAHTAASFLTPPSAFDLSTMTPHACPSSAQAGLLQRSALKIAPSTATTGRQHPSGVTATSGIVYSDRNRGLANHSPGLTSLT